MREATEKWNNDPMMNNAFRGVGNFIGEEATKAGMVITGGSAI